ncbi:sortase [Pseudoclavibacter sp. 13-3]|uniref:sortase n=1 Tax=Pseudoclavibacter sp. 13-3 TaxID=2901228 RepID=UPI001E4AD60C|nr:sortase [Pseudoclavibacter sp. 13-3]
MRRSRTGHPQTTNDLASSDARAAHLCPRTQPDPTQPGRPPVPPGLTAHAGLPQSKLLTDLSKAEVGDTFWISVLGEDHHYQVMSTEVVLPSDTDSLKITQGDAGEELGADGVPLGFPWWAVWLAGGSGAVGWMLFAPPRKKGKKRRGGESEG